MNTLITLQMEQSAIMQQHTHNQLTGNCNIRIPDRNSILQQEIPYQMEHYHNLPKIISPD